MLTKGTSDEMLREYVMYEQIHTHVHTHTTPSRNFNARSLQGTSIENQLQYVHIFALEVQRSELPMAARSGEGGGA